ncbi:SWIM zinc finger family protein [Nocardia carnea]|uniref:SWIM zinc finger family protein n=1 Tax=Nocardia carnea TaxID=37328 RepID=A0ABW7TVW0_9NOCA|nr:SWIM zinc finger family protein [Nocardia carnea]
MADFAEYGKRRPVSGGASTRNRRGGFARNFWGKALLEVMERLADPGRLARGRTYARAGQVVSYRIEPGLVTAEVQGSQPRPFTTTCEIRRLRPEEVELVVEVIRSAPGMLARIVSGDLPRELAPHLVPETAADIDFGCSCPDPGWPCKHAIAVVCLLAERLDDHPRDLLAVRGLSIERLIGGVETATEQVDETTDPYGDALELPELPSPRGGPALDELDPALLRRALRMLCADETTAAAGNRALVTMYTSMTEG